MSSAAEARAMNLFGVLAVILVILALAGVTIAIGVYVYRDAKRRGMNAALWALIAILAPTFIGLIVYLLVRSNYADLRCPNCASPIKEEYMVCPNCATKLRASCPKCGVAVERGWKVCPMCMEPLPSVQSNIRPAVEKKDISLVKIIALAIAIPLLLIGLLLSMMMVGSPEVETTSTATSCQETVLEDYYHEMVEVNGKEDIFSSVSQWIDGLPVQKDMAYVLRYFDSEYGECYYLIYLWGAQGQTTVDVGIANHQMTLKLQKENEGASLFHLWCNDSSIDTLSILLDGECIAYRIEDVEYNPTVLVIR